MVACATHLAYNVTVRGIGLFTPFVGWVDGVSTIRRVTDFTAAKRKNVRRDKNDRRIRFEGNTRTATNKSRFLSLSLSPLADENLTKKRTVLLKRRLTTYRLRSCVNGRKNRK